MKISKEDARRFLIDYQHLSDSHSLFGEEGILEYIKKVGCIQYDPLNIVGRNADLVLQARIKDYSPTMLEKLLYEKRSLVDGWDKMMSIYSLDDWPYFHFVREQKGIETIQVLKNRKQADALLYTNTVIEMLAENGPLLPKQIQLGSAEAGSWGHRNISSATMDYLYHIGRIGVYTKRNVSKVYDLIENILPADVLDHPNPFETEYDFCKWYVYRRIGGVGMIWNRNGGGWLGQFLGDKNLRQHILDEYVEDGLLQCVEIESISDKFYVRSGDVPLDINKSDEPDSMGFIAPLDNLLWDRDMLSKLFGFDYTWEVYLPAAKRKFGYYVIPVIYKNHFVARFEPEKSNSHVCIKNWWWEKDIQVSNDLIECAMETVKRFSAYLERKEGVHESVYSTIKRGH